VRFKPSKLVNINMGMNKLMIEAPSLTRSRRRRRRIRRNKKELKEGITN